MPLIAPEFSHLKSYEDNRGELYPCWRKRNSKINFVEDRFSRSKKGVVRGFHGDSTTYKLCTCVYGELFLVLWDIENKVRYEYTLTEKNKLQVLVPPNFLNAHQCLSSECILFYKWSEYYGGPESQWSINYKDPDINVEWPVDKVTLSGRDQGSKFLSQVDYFD